MSATFRNKTTKRTDVRVRLMNEIINGIQIIKFYAWEKNFAKVIEKTRKKELKAVKGSNYIMALLYSMWAVSRVSLFLTLITYVYAGNVLTARKVFIVSAFYNILNDSMVHFWPLAIAFCAEGFVSARRLKEFLLIKETKPLVKSCKDGSTDAIKKEKDSVETFTSLLSTGRLHHPESTNKGLVSFEKVTAAWVNEDGESTVGLSSINIKLEPGHLYAIVGSVGSGKTSILHAILGELELDSGLLEVHGALSYANQESFIFEGSVRSNILFTEEYDSARYSEVVSVCGLSKDFEIFEHGDDTLVGEKGISLSGGQKARINLARAVYRKADIYLLDDPLSAVDSHVGKSIFKQCILRFLKEKTVVLVTHQIQHLHRVENIIVMSNGEIKAIGSYLELEKMDVPLLMPSDNHDKHEVDEKAVKSPTKQISIIDDDDSLPEEVKETQEAGKISMSVYKKYFSSIKSIPLVIIVLALRVVTQSVASFIDYFVAQWVNWEESIVDRAGANSTDISNSTDESVNQINLNDQTRQSFVNYYIGIISIFVVMILNAEFSFFYALLRASKNLHDMMFKGLTKTFMLFFNQNPSGRILNRFAHQDLFSCHQ